MSVMMDRIMVRIPDIFSIYGLYWIYRQTFPAGYWIFDLRYPDGWISGYQDSWPDIRFLLYNRLDNRYLVKYLSGRILNLISSRILDSKKVILSGPFLVRWSRTGSCVNYGIWLNYFSTIAGCLAKISRKLFYLIIQWRGKYTPLQAGLRIRVVSDPTL